MPPWGHSLRPTGCNSAALWSVQVRVAAPVAGAAARVGPHRAAAARHCLRVGGPVSATVGTLSTHLLSGALRPPAFRTASVCARVVVCDCGAVSLHLTGSLWPQGEMRIAGGAARGAMIPVSSSCGRVGVRAFVLARAHRTGSTNGARAAAMRPCCGGGLRARAARACFF